MESPIDNRPHRLLNHSVGPKFFNNDETIQRQNTMTELSADYFNGFVDEGFTGVDKTSDIATICMECEDIAN